MDEESFVAKGIDLKDIKGSSAASENEQQQPRRQTIDSTDDVKHYVAARKGPQTVKSKSAVCCALNAFNITSRPFMSCK